MSTSEEDRQGIPEGYRSEEEQARIMDVTISTLRIMAVRRRGPPRVKRGRQILYRMQAYEKYLLALEVDYDNLRAGAAGDSS